MTEHKYTDEEVIKALDHCRNGERGSKCSKCEYVTGCKHWLIGLAVDLINRQKKEIAFWKQTHFSYEGNTRFLAHMEHERQINERMQALKKLLNKTEDELYEARGEIEKMRKVINADLVIVGRRGGKSQQAKEIIRIKTDLVKAEAIKEFAWKLKEKAYVNKPYGVGKSVDECDVDALVKEMTEI